MAPLSEMRSITGFRHGHLAPTFSYSLLNTLITPDRQELVTSGEAFHHVTQVEGCRRVTGKQESVVILGESFSRARQTAL